MKKLLLTLLIISVFSITTISVTKAADITFFTSPGNCGSITLIRPSGVTIKVYEPHTLEYNVPKAVGIYTFTLVFGTDNLVAISVTRDGMGIDNSTISEGQERTIRGTNTTIKLVDVRESVVLNTIYADIILSEQGTVYASSRSTFNPPSMPSIRQILTYNYWTIPIDEITARIGVFRPPYSPAPMINATFIMTEGEEETIPNTNIRINLVDVFGNKTYYNSQGDSISEGTYTITANPCSGYLFYRWIPYGGVSVQSNVNPTLVTISGTGTLIEQSRKERKSLEVAPAIPNELIYVLIFAVIAVIAIALYAIYRNRH